MSASSAAYSVARPISTGVEADLAGALAAHFLEGDGLAVQVAQRQVVHVVPLVRLEHVGLQQRVVHDAAQLHAVIGEHVAVVLQVLAELRFGRILQPGLHALQHQLARQLLGRVRIAVRRAEYRPPRPARRTAKCQPVAPPSDRARWFRYRSRSAARGRCAPAIARVAPSSARSRNAPASTPARARQPRTAPLAGRRRRPAAPARAGRRRCRSVRAARS